MKQLTALVLAGTRASGDPLAAYADVSHKALIEVGGRTMIERVVSALAAVPEVARIVVAIERPELLTDLPELQPHVCGKPLTTMAPASGPSATVAAALASEGAPLLVTTADHALLQTSWLSDFLAGCPKHADVCVALGRRDVVHAAAPHTKRTWLRFADGHFSGCNLFLMARPAATGAAELWCELERHRKDPLQLMRRLGWSVALRYQMGQLTLAAALGRLGELAGGARLAVVEMSDGRAAIDVDKPEDLDLVRELVGS
jgi:GTP:adenosylcobinamide-phosphate guanylyltransferase